MLITIGKILIRTLTSLYDLEFPFLVLERVFRETGSKFDLRRFEADFVCCS